VVVVSNYSFRSGNGGVPPILRRPDAGSSRQ
jgi:hypothetical protein